MVRMEFPMIASDFSTPPRQAFSAWSRYLSYIPLYGIGVPLVKLLDATGIWPRIIAASARSAAASPFGNYVPGEADVFVCAGFKSGTTWALQIATQITYRGAAEFSNIHHVVPWPDAPSVMQTQIIPLTNDSPRQCAPTGLRIIKSHLAQEDIPYSTAARYIVVVRDPKDVIVSGYHFLKSMVFGPLMPTVNHWVHLFLRGETGHASWGRHLAGFWRIRDRTNVLFLTFESMKRDMPATVARIAEFMGVELTDAELAAVVQASSWQAMKQAQDKFDPGQILPWSGRNYFLRRGQSGGSSELLTPAMQKHIDDNCRAELRQLGCDFPFDQAFAPSRETAGRTA
jgi:hypothetical protein